MSFSAVITGGSGKIGAQLIGELTSQKIPVLSISRSLNKNDGYLTCVNSNLLTLNKLPQAVSDWSVKHANNRIVFFNLAWSGQNRLTDGSISRQLGNINMLTNAISMAKKMGCSLFINAGTAEEFFVRDDLRNWQDKPGSLDHYGFAKATAYSYAQILTYLNQIDVIHVRFSAVVNALSGKFDDSGFIYRNMVKISKGEPTDNITSSRLFDFIETGQLVKALISLVEVAKNKEEYYIGPNYPLRISEFLDLIKMELEGVNAANFVNRNNFADFNNDLYVKRTGNSLTFNAQKFI